MLCLKKTNDKNGISGIRYLKEYVKFRSSIYGRVVFIITISSFFLFVSFWIIFRSVNEGYMKSVIQ